MDIASDWPRTGQHLSNLPQLVEVHDACSVDKQLRPYPGSYARQPTYPGGQWGQTPTERRSVAVQTIDGGAESIEAFAASPLHQRDAVVAMDALVMVSRASLTSGERRHQLILLPPGRVEEFARIVVAVRQQVTTAVQLRDQAMGHRFLPGVHGRYLPRLGHRAIRPNRVQLIAFRHD